MSNIKIKLDKVVKAGEKLIEGAKKPIEKPDPYKIKEVKK